MSSVSFFIKENENFTEKYCATTEMLSRLIEESRRSTLFFVNLNSDILDHFVKSHNLTVTVEVNDLKTNSNLKKYKIDAVILHLENYVEFENFYKLIRTETFLYDGHFIILYDMASVKEIEKIFSKFWKAYIYNVNLLVTHPSSSDLISMFTYMPFSDGLCNNTKIFLINEFNKTTMKWATNTFYPKKFKQLNRCPIRFGCYDNKPGFIIENDENGTRKFSGMNVDVGVVFSEVLNFTLNMLEFEQEMGVIYKNKTATAMLKRAIFNEVDVIFASLQEDRVVALSATRKVYSDKLILVVPPPYLIDPMTKIFMPFTFASWISIGMIALLACCIIKLLKFTPTIVHDYVIGSNVKGSILNVCNIFFGGTQEKLPQSNFPRFLLMKFLIFTMIMRTLYQGEVFNLLKRDVRTVELNTIDEFMEHKFTFYIYQALAARLQGTKMMQRFVQFYMIIVLSIDIIRKTYFPDTR